MGLNAEQLFRAVFRGPTAQQVDQTDGWAGRSTVDSGSASIVISTTVVQSDSFFRLAFSVGSAGAVASRQGPYVINSVVDGTSFAITTITGVAYAWDNVVMWEIVKTK